MGVVTSRDELKAAKDRGDKEIVVKGDLADKLKKSKQVGLLSTGALVALGVALGAATMTAPVTGGMSYFAATPIAALSGVEVAGIIIAAAIGQGNVPSRYRQASRQV